MIDVFLVFFWCSPNCDVVFKITNRLKINNDNLKFNDDFKSHIAVGGHQENIREHLAFSKKKKKNLKIYEYSHINLMK